MGLRTFFLSMNVLNGLLAAAVAAVVYFAVIPVLNPVVRISLPSATQETALYEEEKAMPRNLSPVDYALISEQNLFHPERKIPPEKLPEKVIPKPDLLLYGTLVGSDESFAFIEDRKSPHSTTGRGKRHVTVKRGDSVSGYILTEIETDRIVLAKGEDKIVVMLTDRQKRRTSQQASPMTADPRTLPGGTVPSFPSAMSPQAPQAAPSPAPGMAVPASPQFRQTTPSSAQGSGFTRVGNGGLRLSQQFQQTAPSSSGSGMGASGLQQFPQSTSSSSQAESSTAGPGIGGSGTWPPTKGSVEQTRQKIDEGRRMRQEQMQRKQ